LWAAVITVYFGGLLVLRLTQWEAQTYFTMMWLWTLAPVAIGVAFISMVDGLRVTSPSRPRAIPALCAVGLVVVGGANLMVSTAEASLWSTSATDRRAAAWHYDLADQLQLASTAVWDGSLTSAGPVFDLQVDQPSDLTGTDDDRVLINGLVSLLESKGLRCGNCIRNPDVGWVYPEVTGSPDRSLLVVGSTTCGDRSELLVGQAFALCARTAD
jgi:hypothetical protein